MSMSPRLLRPRATGFNPKSISGLAAWWDFSDATTVTVATGISSVTDKSGNGRALVQNTANNQPAYTANSIAGKSAAVFDGVNDTLESSFTLAQPCHYFAVMKYNVAYSSGGPRAWDGFSVVASYWRTGENEMRMNAGGSDRIANNLSSGTLNAYGVHELRLDALSSQILINGARLDAGSGTGSNAPNGIRLAVFNNGFSSPGNVSFAELLIYTNILGASSASRVRSYLGKKYGITVT